MDKLLLNTGWTYLTAHWEYLSRNGLKKLSPSQHLRLENLFLCSVPRVVWVPYPRPSAWMMNSSGHRADMVSSASAAHLILCLLTKESRHQKEGHCVWNEPQASGPGATCCVGLGQISLLGCILDVCSGTLQTNTSLPSLKWESWDFPLWFCLQLIGY